MADEDDDWFERAFADDDDEESAEPADSTEPSEPDADASEDDDEESGGFEDAFGGDEDARPESGQAEETSADDFEAAFGGTGGGSDGGDADASDDADDFEAAFSGTGGGGGGSSDDFEAAFGGTGGGGADDFEAAFGGGGGGDGDGGGEFGFDLDAGGEDTDFDEEFESDIPRVKLGIEGLDNMVQGGVPERSLIVAIGSAGTGKTTFGLQFLNHALENDERAVFITLEETEERIVDSANEKGWNFGEHIANGDLAVIDLDPIEMANSLTSIRNELPRLVEDFGATRLVLDSVSLLEMMYDDQATRRTEIYDFTKALKNAGVTTMLTSEAAEDNPYASRHGIIEYLTDAVFLLRYIRPEDFRETRLAVEIQKIRDANHSRETKPYEITSQGISVYRQANIF
ncbi:KaiC domain-containing protein [Salarchaeum japonicum]|uniref:KaiC domain-containing protein n=1 Tax=Salarchaeum japonicum TaxID=555573 RepID=A0AAV3SYV9_9EURY|nr:KaiC domain-containing protein [Salarchaeum japonicum]